MKYQVIVVDDSPTFRDFIRSVINQIEEFEVIDTANDAYDAREKIKKYDPDLVLIDINMPKMDGILFLKNLMRLRPMPSFVISGEKGRNREIYEEGALGFIEKKKDGETIEAFIERVKNMLLSFSYLYDKYRETRGIQAEKGKKRLLPDAILPQNPSMGASRKIIAIGASTGGVEAISHIFSKLPANLPPIVIAQHIPYGFSKNFASRLDKNSALNVVEVNQTYALENGCAYISTGNSHIVVSRCEESRKYLVSPLEGPKICYQRPSINVLFRSVNNVFGKAATALVLTGMGDDGSIGIKELYDNGAYTIAQDEKSSVVFGMPKKAIESGGIRETVPLEKIPDLLTALFQTN